MSIAIAVLIRGRPYSVPEDRLDACAPIVEPYATGSWFRVPPDVVEAFGRALFADDWPAIVAAVDDAPELGRVITGTYIELAAAAGLLPSGSA